MAKQRMDAAIAVPTIILGQRDDVSRQTLLFGTNWLPHTTRAALTGLRKKGHIITASKVDGASLYRIQVAG